MIVWTITGGESGAADTLHRAAQEAGDAALAWLTNRVTAIDVGDHLPAVLRCLDTAEILAGALLCPGLPLWTVAVRPRGHRRARPRLR